MINSLNTNTENLQYSNLNNFSYYSSFNLQQRKNKLNERVQYLAGKILPEKTIKLKIEPFNETAHQSETITHILGGRFPFYEIEKLQNVNLPMHYLFKYEDIPFQFRIKDFNDPRLKDEKFLNSFAQWVNSINQQLKLPNIDTKKNICAIKKFLTSLCNEELFEKAHDFVIAHEISHALDKNRSSFLFLENFRNIERLTFATILAAILLIVALAIIPFVNLIIVLSLVGISLVVAGGSISIMVVGTKKCRGIEKNCDMNAAKVLNDARGGIYHFENSIRRHLGQLEENPSLPINPNGDFRLDLVHPRLSERVKYLKKWQSNPTGGQVIDFNSAHLEKDLKILGQMADRIYRQRHEELSGLRKELSPELEQHLDKRCKEANTSSLSTDIILKVQAEVCAKFLSHTLENKNLERVHQILDQLRFINHEHANKLFELLWIECGKPDIWQFGEKAFYDVPGYNAPVHNKVEAARQLHMGLL